MKREKKNEISLNRILRGALKEFSEKGYDGASINIICSSENLSKGILYHYFSTKEELYLACVSQCFSELTEYLKENIKIENDEKSNKSDIRKQLENYFMVRFDFFSNILSTKEFLLTV